MPPHLLSNMLKVLSNLSPNIRILEVLHTHLLHRFFLTRNDITASFAYKVYEQEGQKGRFHMENWQFFQYPTLVSQCPYQIPNQTRWHPLATDKIYLS